MRPLVAPNDFHCGIANRPIRTTNGAKSFPPGYEASGQIAQSAKKIAGSGINIELFPSAFISAAFSLSKQPMEKLPDKCQIYIKFYVSSYKINSLHPLCTDASE